MIILRSNFYSKKKKDDREISGKRSVKSGLKAAGLTLAGGTTLGALGVGTLGRAGADVLTKNKKIIKRSRNLGATVGALGGAAQAAQDEAAQDGVRRGDDNCHHQAVALLEQLPVLSQRRAHAQELSQRRAGMPAC